MTKPDAMDAARIGEHVRDAVAETFFDWVDDSGCGASSITPEDRQRAFDEATSWMNQLPDRDFGERVLQALERAGFTVTPTPIGEAVGGPESRG